MVSAYAPGVGSATRTLPISLGEALQELSEPWPPGDRIKAAIARAARAAGMTYWRTFDLWYGKARRVEDFEIDAVAAALEHKREMDARNELSALRLRLARLETALEANTGIHRPTIDPLRSGVRRGR